MEHKKFCPNCGGNIENFSGKFCPHCGHQIYENISENSSLMEKFSLSDEQKEQLKQKTSEITEIAKEKGKVYGKNLQTFLCYLWEQLKKFFAFLKVQYFKYKPIVIQKSKEFVVVVRNFYKTQKTKIFIIWGIILTLGVATFVGIYFVKPYLENISKKDIVSTEKQGDVRQSKNTSNTDNQKENFTNNATNISVWSVNTPENSGSTKNTLTEVYYYIEPKKSFFYTNPTDAEPRKAYVMMWDVVKVIPEKSTGNMFFALYTNSAGKTTEGYLKKEHLQEAGHIIQADEILLQPKMQESIKDSINRLNLYTMNKEKLIVQIEKGINLYDKNLDTQMVLKEKDDENGVEWYMGLNVYDMFTGFSVSEDCGHWGCDVTEITWPHSFKWVLWGKATRDTETYPCYAETDLSIPQTKLLYCDMNKSSPF